MIVYGRMDSDMDWKKESNIKETCGDRDDAGSVASTGTYSEALIVETQHVWSEVYGRVVSRDEALRILSNVRRLGNTLFLERNHEHRNVG